MSQDASGQISTVMQEKRLFPPSKAFALRTIVPSAAKCSRSGWTRTQAVWAAAVGMDARCLHLEFFKPPRNVVTYVHEFYLI